LTPDEVARFIPFSLEQTGRLGEDALGFMALLEQCHNVRVGDGAPAEFRKLRAAFLLDLGMIIARGNAKILRRARAEARLVQYPEWGGADEEGFYDAFQQLPIEEEGLVE
jgi:hypothetical protein